MLSKNKGFTLIELMIVVAVIAILTAIAYPSYVDYVRKTRYAQAKEGAMQVASALERAVSQSVAYPAKPLSSTIITPPYPDVLSYDYEPKPAVTGGPNTRYYLIVTDNRFGIWVGVNGMGAAGGTHCGCDGKKCTATSSVATSFDETKTSCDSADSF